MRYKQWKIAHPSPEGRAQLERAGIIPSLLACVLSARGVTEPEQAWKLLTPGEEPLLDPMLLKDMDRAVLRVGRALKTGELMAVYGDYDVDGITSTPLRSMGTTTWTALRPPVCSPTASPGWGGGCAPTSPTGWRRATA